MAIQIRRGTNTEWESNNSNIVAGEPAIATDAERFFVGTASGDYAEFANLDIIAPAYDTTASYVVGDIINYHGKLYSCNTPCSGTFNVSYWDEKSLAEILKDLENEIDYAQYEIGYADGELITINNGASEIPVKDLKIGIEAVQDLHGYDHPWVGGAGANKLSAPPAETKSDHSVTCVADGNGKYTLNGTATNGNANLTFTLPVGYTIQSGDYLHFMNSSANSSAVLALKFSDNTSAAPSITPVNRIWSLDGYIGKTITSLRFYIVSGVQFNATLTPMILASSTATDFVPYSNICPISGWDEVNVNVAGKNLLVDGLTWGNIDATGADSGNSHSYIRTINYSSVKPSTTYYIHVNKVIDRGATQLYSIEYDEHKNILNRVQRASNNTQTEITRSFITTPNTAYVRFFYYKDYGFDSYDDMKIWLTTEETTPYEPYNGQTYTIDLDGTRYGGTLDVTTGVLTIDKAVVDLGTLTWQNNGTDSVFTPISNKSVGSDNTICSALFKVDQGTSSGVMPSGSYKTYADTGSIAVKLSGITSSTANTVLSGFVLVYELATPQVVQLTPTQVRTVLGTNNIWNQMNTNNELAYRISNALN